MTGLGMKEIMMLIEDSDDSEDLKYDSEKEVLRGAKKIVPTKITNLVCTVATARNTLLVGHRHRGDVGKRLYQA